jgi:putative DNA primase/helicase
MSFEAALRAAGLLPRAVVPDGRWRRCPTEDHPRRRNGAHVLYPDGRGYFKNWATDADVSSWRDEATVHAAPIDSAWLRRHRERERQRRMRAIAGARRFWSDSPPLVGSHPYLERKGLSALGCTGLRTRAGLLVVPVMVDDVLVSVQTIGADGEKKFWPGAPTRAGAYVLRRQRAAVTCLAEGLSTGLAVFQSVPTATVVVVFNAGNLSAVVERLKPSGSVVVAADNDHRTLACKGVNPGLDAARNTAELIGCGVAYPTGIEGTDWCDYLAEVGEGAPRRLERVVLAEARFVMR